MDIECKGNIDLKNVESKYKLLFECAQDIVMLININGKVVDVNNAAVKEYGYLRETLLSMKVGDLRAPPERDTAEKQLREAFVKGMTFETVHRRKDGSLFPVEVSSGGVVLGGEKMLVVIVRDITKRKEAERNRARMTAIVESSDDAILGMTPEGIITEWNHGAELLYGYTAKEMIDRSVDVLIPRDHSGELAGIIDMIKRGELLKHFDTVRIRKGGTPVNVSLTASPIIGLKGELLGISWTARDITSRKKLEEDREKVLHRLGERVKELNALHSIARIFQKQSTIPKLLQEMVSILPPAWQYPDVTTARVTYDGNEYRSKHFIEGRWRQIAEFATSNGKKGAIEVFYIEEKPPEVEGPFLAEERNLINSLAEMLRIYLDRKQAEMALLESENKFRVLAETSPAAIFLYQGEKYLYVNPMAETLTGYSRDELLTGDAWGWIHADFRDLVRERAIRRQQGEILPNRYGVKYCSKDGREGWVDFTAGQIEYRGKPAGLAMAIDVTERKRAEDAIRESNEMLRLVMNNIPQRIFWKDTHSVYMGCNDNFALDAGFGRPESIVGKTDFDLAWTREESEAYRRDDREVMDNNRPKFHIIEPQRQADGTQSWLDTNKIPLHDANGKVFGILGTYEDITDRKLSEIQLKEAKAQAELYLDLMGHDITNMNQALMGYLEMMKVMREAGEIDKGLIDSSIDVINRSSRMINDVKKLTQLQAEKISLKNVDVCEILSMVKSKYSDIPGRFVTIDYTPGQDCMVRAGDLLKDVFENLVDNAIRHSTGPVIIDLAIDRVTKEGHAYYKISVSDTGPGIPDDLKRKIFISIEDAVEKTSRRGFGLYLVRTLIDHYHGQVWVEDRVKGDHTKGARFVVMLPAVDN